jgi:acetyltransferase-like isoleucine patch superfamily enzyme
MRRSLRFLLGEVLAVLLKLCIVPQLRVAVLKLLGARIGRNTVIHRVSFINYYRGSFRNIHFGDECFIGDGCLLDLAACIRLERQVTLASRVCIATHLNVGYPDHPLQRDFPARTEAVGIGAGCFVGMGATILCGVRIGAGSFVGAGSVVAESLPAGVLAGGVPARVIRAIGGR